MGDRLAAVKRRVRWPRFGLRTLLIAVTLVCVWFGVFWSRVQRQRACVAWIRSLEGSVYYQYEVDGGNDAPVPWHVSLLGPDCTQKVRYFFFYDLRVRDEELRDIGCLRDLTDVEVAYTDLGDGFVHQITACKSLRDLVLTGTLITDRAMKDISSMSELRYLVLSGTDVTDDGLPALGAMPNLISLELHDTGITDAGLSRLPRFPRLETLVLDHTSISDEGLAHLSRIPTLRYISVNQTKVTDEAVFKLRKTLPGCSIPLP